MDINSTGAKVTSLSLLGAVAAAALYTNSRLAKKGAGMAALAAGVVGALGLFASNEIGKRIFTVGGAPITGLPRGSYFGSDRYLPHVGSLFLPADGGLPQRLGYIDAQRVRGNVGLLDVQRSKVGLIDISRRMAGRY